MRVGARLVHCVVIGSRPRRWPDSFVVALPLTQCANTTNIPTNQRGATVMPEQDKVEPGKTGLLFSDVDVGFKARRGRRHLDGGSGPDGCAQAQRLRAPPWR